MFFSNKLTSTISDRPRNSSALAFIMLFSIGLIGYSLMAILGNSAYAAPRVWYVDKNNPSCSDTGPGDITQPLCTIQKGATLANAGESVQVAAGTYNENVTPSNSGSAGLPVTFTSAPGSTVIVSGQTHSFTISNKSYISIQNFSVSATSGDGILVSGSNNITVANNTVTTAGHPVSGQLARGIHLDNSSNSTVSGNSTHDNSDAGVYVTGTSTQDTISGNISYNNANQFQRSAPGIDIRSNGNIIVGNNTHDNEDTGIQLYTGANNNLVVNNVTYNNGDHGIDNLNVTGGRIIGNTVYRNCTSGINVEGTSGNYLIENNIAVDNAVYPAYKGIACSRRNGNIGIYDSAVNGTVANNNIVWLTTSGTLYRWAGVAYTTLSSLQSATGQEARGLQSDPRWVSVSSWDLHLASGSPAIDSADSWATGQQAVDLAGTPRFDDPVTPNTGVGPRAYDDRGAYEYTSAVTPTPTSTPTATPSPTPTPTSVVTPTPTQTPTPTPTPTPAGGTTISKQIAAENDDAEETVSSGSMYLNSTDLEFTWDGHDQMVGMRFAGLTVPHAATITNAYIEFTAKETQPDTTNLTFYAQDADNAATFTSTAFNVSSRPKTSASVAWSNIPVWSVEGTYRTPSLTSLVQTIVNRTGWTSGNAAAIIVTGTGHRTAYSYGGSAVKAAKLVITYQ